MPVDIGSPSGGKGVVLVMSAVLALFFISVLLVAGVAAFVFVAWSAGRQAEREAVLRAETAENLQQLQLALQRVQTELRDAPADDEATQPLAQCFAIALAERLKPNLLPKRELLIREATESPFESMLQTLKELLANQYEAALCTLAHCIDPCDENAWNAPVGNLAFCQVVFHTLFFTDLYLGENESEIREQPFHLDRPEFFRDYEELQPRQQTLLYTRSDVLDYLQHCRRKAADTLERESADSLGSRCGFPGRTFSRAELHLYNIRHIQHHAAQLSLRLRLDAAHDIPWIGSGWRDPARTVS